MFLDRFGAGFAGDQVTSSPTLARCAPNSDPNAPAPRITIFMAIPYVDSLYHAKFLRHAARKPSMARSMV